MKNKSRLLMNSMIAFIMVAALFFVTQPILADDDDNYKIREYYGEHEEEEDGALEEGGELLGWGTVIAIGGAAIIMPLRRNSAKLMKALPLAKGFIKSLLKFFGKFHIWIGAIAIALSGVHGTLLFLHEREFETEVVLGIISFSFMAIAAIFGVKLAKNKGASKIRSTHFGLLFVAMLIAAFHIFTS